MKSVQKYAFRASAVAAFFIIPILILMGCGPNDECPACPNPSGPLTIEINSGAWSNGVLGECPSDIDSLTIVSSTGRAPEPALIWGGHTGAECPCVNDNYELGSGKSRPISSRYTDVTRATYKRTFTLPANVKWVELKLAVAADDWAQVFLNDSLIGMVELSGTGNYPAAPAIHVYDTSLFVEGKNTIRFEAGNGVYPDTRPRSSDGDCFWIEFSGTVEYEY